ncbi:hypothetical protein BDN72DRAFT_834644 [Pluteus cervinus]|uniref:Uncharacterized protein n=1 Tax=Pluteus cervinus TaxID=181527 RepID=A0ACD3B622_9AGAR|nr:hypothetical protein BDN72DRAFT_834644 [Pluteus cervinus]
MTSAPKNPVDVPPYQFQQLISSVADDFSAGFGDGRLPIHVRCVQALDSEIYVGCANGELLRFALQADDPDKLASYSLLARQTVPDEKAVDEIVLIPSISRALVLSDKQLHFYSLPALRPVSIKPVRHALTLAVDYQHLQRPPPNLSNSHNGALPVEFCVIKRSSIVMYALTEQQLFYRKEMPFPQSATLARRSGYALCIADKENYNIVDLEAASAFPILPLSQAADQSLVIQPSITVISDNEFLILSWTGASTLGVFINGNGEPIRGTLEWPSYPESVSLDYPYVTALLPNNTIEIHSIETQAIVQVIGAPAASPRNSTDEEKLDSQRLQLVASTGGYLVPTNQGSSRMRLTKVPLQRNS